MCPPQQPFGGTFRIIPHMVDVHALRMRTYCAFFVFFFSVFIRGLAQYFCRMKVMRFNTSFAGKESCDRKLFFFSL